MKSSFRLSLQLERANQALAGLLLARRRPQQISTGLVWFSAIAILLFASFLRFHRLSYQSLWLDEIITWVRSGQPTLDQVIEHGRGANWPPAYFLFMHGYTRYLGTSEFVLRFPSALVGVLMIAALFSLGRKLYNVETGLAAALIGTVTWMPIHYSQEARPYTLLFLLATLMTLYWVCLLEQLKAGDRPALRYVIAYSLTVILCIYSHYFGLLLVATHATIGFLVLIRKPRKLLQFAAMFVFIGLAYLPWIQTLFSTVDNASTWLALPAGYPRLLMSYISFLMGDSQVLTILFFTLVFFAAIVFFRQKHSLKRLQLITPGVLLTLIWLVPFTIAFLRSVLISPVLNNRYLIISAPAVYILLARILTAQALKRGVQVFLVLAFSAYALFFLVAEKGYYAEITKGDFRQAVAYVMADGGPGNDSLIISVPDAPYDYYFQRMGWDGSLKLADPVVIDLAEVQQTLSLQQPTYVWYLTTKLYLDTDILDYLKEQEATAVQHRWESAEVWLFRVQTP